MADYSIIVPDSESLSRICGTNDMNLKLIESFLGLPIFARGNELSIDCDDDSVCQQFRFLINRILDELADNPDRNADEEILRSVIGSSGSSSGDHSFFSRHAISVPGGVRKVYPRTRGQALLVKAMRTNDLVFASGPAGSGKTFLAVAESLRLVLSHEVSGIVMTRPVVEAGENLGFLPGDLNEKINPYMRPLYDAMNAVLPRDTVRRMMENGIIEVAPLAYMRGRTLSNCAVILDEAQNTTAEQMKMFLTRMGENTKMFVTGDPGQTDLPAKKVSGLVHALDVLEGVPGISMVSLTAEDVVRSELVKRIIRAYENEKK